MPDRLDSAEIEVGVEAIEEFEMEETQAPPPSYEVSNQPPPTYSEVLANSQVIEIL